MTTMEEAIGQVIRRARRNQIPEWSMEKLAEVSGVSRQTVDRVENGRGKKAMFTTIAAIAVALGMSLDDLLAQASEAVAEEPAGYGMGVEERLRQELSRERGAHGRRKEGPASSGKKEGAA